MSSETTSDPVEATVAAWRAAGEAGDAEAAAKCLADDAQLISPLTAEFRFTGRDQIHDMLISAFEVISDIRYHTVVGDDSARAVFFYGRAGGEEFEEAQLLRFDSAGLISELTLFGRPLPGVTAVMARIGPHMMRRQGRTRLAMLISAATKPLAAVTRSGERRLVPLTNPNRESKRSR